MTIVILIFVHGLTGDYEQTWKAENAADPWPKSLLPSIITNARLLTFGYDANVIGKGQVSENGLREHAMALVNDLARVRNKTKTNERPIIFACHSLGGLLCKDALGYARDCLEERHRQINCCTRGIVFIGTPHHGSDLAPVARKLARYLGRFKQTNSAILDVLEKGSDTLSRIQRDFANMLRSRNEVSKDPSHLSPIEIVCFFEELPLDIVGTVVSKDSAIMPSSNAIGLHCNHIDMTKFDDKEDENFDRIAAELQEMCNKIAGDKTDKTDRTSLASHS
ncbi:uncharacterized protein N7482_006684 [Penicillium canariense]|uniref:DUF676 domain-containing protein n=1 Tax=Penicillium canariense TaxID=189055 RepID=A0A9W9LJ67_9EURO|nr:uncharacterized protein N7482_006684 [Penicillium canariense]KAJ5159680.1 hypothetical protein N7482_006684 [Penicillium canariense]